MRALEDIGMIGFSQVRCQERDRGQRQRTLGQQIEDHRKAPRGPRGLDASIRRVLREVQELRAVGEERRAPLAEIQPALVHLRQQRDEPDRRVPLAAGGDLDLREKLMVRQVGYCELTSAFPFVASSFLTLGNALSRAIAGFDRPHRRITREVRAQETTWPSRGHVEPIK